MNINTIHKKLNSVVLSFEGVLHDVGVNNVLELLGVREYRVAYEMLSDILHEDEIPIPQNTYDELVHVGKTLNVDGSYWEDLSKLVTKGE